MSACSCCIDHDAIRERIAEGDGFWRTCSGCYETEDGYPNGRYPHSAVFGCTLGGGCSECGGIGAVWDTTDYAAMGDELSREQLVTKDRPDPDLDRTLSAVNDAMNAKEA